MFVALELRSVDAYKENGAWRWNDSSVLEGDIVFEESALTARTILSRLRSWGYLPRESKGMLTIEDLGDVIEIQNRYSGEPILALVRQWEC